MGTKNIKYDVVVIGAGNAGLVAATTCAQKGYKTLLIEQHNLPGGFASSFVRGRFEFEIALHELGNFGNKQLPGDVYNCFEELGIKLEWKKIDDAFRLIVKENGIDYDFTLPFGEEEFAKACDKYEPGSYDSVKNFIDVCANCYYAVRYINSTRGNPDPNVLKKEYPNYLTTAIYTLEDGMKKIKIPKLIRYIIGSYWTYLGTPPSKISFMLFAIMFYEYIKFNAYIPANRSHEISQTIVSRFEQLGGKVWYNTKALKIDVENNHVKGLHTTNGYIETKHIISNVSPHLVYGNMIDNDKIPEIDKKITSYREPGTQGLVVYLGLNKSVEELGLKDYSYFVYSKNDHDEIANNIKSIEKNNDYIVVALNVANPNCSPKGTSILTFTTLYDDAWNNVSEKDYFKLKNEIARKFITDFEQKMNVKILENIEEIEVATPVTFARYTGTVNGSIYGYKGDVLDSCLVRAKNIDDFFTINGLRFCGGNGFVAHGYSITYMSGSIMGGKTILDIMKEKENEKKE